MQLLYANNGIESIMNMKQAQKDGIFSSVNITLTQDAHAFNEMEGYQYIITVTCKGASVGDGKRYKGKRFQVQLNSTYIEDFATDETSGIHEFIEYYNNGIL